MSDQQYNNELQGSLFKNDKKTTDSHPDYKGSAQIEGQDYWLSAWINTSKDGAKKYMKLKFEAKQAQGAPSHGSAKTVAISHDMDDELPF
jgi:uncharacterized protein (DUF736 family)